MVKSRWATRLIFVAVGAVMLFDDPFRPIESAAQCCLFLRVRLEPGRYVPSGNQECMVGGDWIAVPEGEYDVVAEDDAFRQWVAEGAGRRVGIGDCVALVGMRWSLLSTSGRSNPRVDAGAR